MFKDEVVILVRSGKGGDGCVSFRREKFVPKGGPDGGDGGKGGDVVFQPDSGVASLGAFHNRQRLSARNGQPGRGGDCTGKAGEDLVLKVPLGTVIRDAERGHLLKDLSDSTEPFVFLCGGKGGRGNGGMATSTVQVPRRAEKGQHGQERKIILELKMVADVGIIGLPNAGKSTLLSRISKARPKVADYPFTTLIPQLGVVEVNDRRIIFADIPGLIEGAHAGQGLGDRFLRHVERTRILLHLIDCRIGLEHGFREAFDTVNREIESYSSRLASKPQLVALSKSELIPEPPDLERLAEDLGCPVLLFSSHTGKGLIQVLGAVIDKLRLEGD